MEIQPSGVAVDGELVCYFSTLVTSIEGLEAVGANLKTIKENITETDDSMKFGITGNLTPTLVKAVNAIEDDLNDTIVFMEADVGIMMQMFNDYTKLEETLAANAGK